MRNVFASQLSLAPILWRVWVIEDMSFLLFWWQKQVLCCCCCFVCFVAVFFYRNHFLKLKTISVFVFALRLDYKQLFWKWARVPPPPPPTSQRTAKIEPTKILDSGFEILDYGFLVSGTWIPDFNRYTDSKAQDSGLHKQNFSGFQSPDFLT